VVGAANIPVASLQQRLFELPPPGEWPLHLIGAADELGQATSLLQSKGWTPQLIENSAGSSATAHLGDVISGPSDAQAWRPNSFLAAVCRSLGRLPFEEQPGLVLDLGCGSGRDAVYIASQLHGRGSAWQVVGIDNHEAALERGRGLAARNGVGAPRCSFVNADLRRDGLETTLQASGCYPSPVHTPHVHTAPPPPPLL
jgi:SAM-dependent methyltransferase